LEIFEELGDLPGIRRLAINLGVQAYADGRWDEAVAMYGKAQEVSRRSGNVSAEGAAAVNLGEVLISRGQLDEAEVLLKEARRVLRAQNVIGFALLAEIQLGRLAMERGENDAAALALTSVIDEATRVDPLSAVDAAVQLADVLIRSGQPQQAIEVVELAQSRAGDDVVLYEVPLQRLRAKALLMMGRTEEALSLVEPALTSAREQRLMYEEALLLVLKAEATKDVETLERADDILGHLGARYPFQRLPSATL
jgi:tetratricopeptide (TPR) repeat protein